MYSPQFQSGPTKIAGQVYTVKLVPRSDVTSPELQGHYVNPFLHVLVQTRDSHVKIPDGPSSQRRRRTPLTT